MSRRASMRRSGPATPGVRPVGYPDAPLFHPGDWPTDRSVWAEHWPENPLHVASLDYACHVMPAAGPERVQLAARAVLAWRNFERYGEEVPPFRTLDEVRRWRASRGLPPLPTAPDAAGRYADRLQPTPIPEPEPISERERFGF
ncbi:hypothetical protein O7630_12165 [Micromonospora sp. WMMD718]|uniref:hypothetical protein n=1 Tax=Micromonospora sp. WMMD718 TaxID=3016098 RepID=UPI00241748A0|nr:hypothetical protein [Micromonospora sp. WMMD718]MDG4751698.1 hypothetical protein [Micromonospora sp. WMMD718]